MLPEQLPPDEEQASTPNRAARFIPWLLVLGMGLLFVPVYLVGGVIADTTTPLVTELESLQQTITAPPPVPADEATLAQQLFDLRSELSLIEGIPPTLLASHIDWPSITAVVHSYNADEIRLTSFNTDTHQISLQGEALQESSVLDYAHLLERTGYFSRVNVQSITVGVSQPPTLDPQATLTPGAPLQATFMPFVFVLTVDLIAGSQ